MAGMWNHLIGQVTKQLRPFNDYLIYGYRKEGLDKIPEYLDKMFHQVVVFFGGQMEYRGYRQLTPVERIQYVLNNQIIKGCVNIRRTETVLYQFEFEFDGRPYHAYIPVPYLINERVVCNDTEYYPQFQIVEKGGVNRTENGTVIVKVMRVPITFGRRPGDKQKLISTSGHVYIEQLISVKIHQGATSTKKGDQIPLVLYHFCKYGYPETMKMYKMDPSDVSISDTFDNDDKEYDYFCMNEGARYLKVRREVLKDSYKLRVVISLYRIFEKIREFTVSDAFGKDLSYYRTVLGKYTSSRETSLNKLLLPNANKHIQMTDPMLDLVAKEALKSVGCDVNDIYELLYWMFYNIDDLLVSYDPTDLFDKKIESLDQIACRVVKKVAWAQYNIINSKRAVLDAKTVEQFCKKCSLRDNWISSDDSERTSKVFRANPSKHNDSFLFTIGMKRSLSLESVASSSSRKNKKKGKKGGGKGKTNPFLLRAHPSYLAVTSILDIPSSSPVVTGSMSPWIEVDHDGNIIKPPYADEIKDVFN